MVAYVFLVFFPWVSVRRQVNLSNYCYEESLPYQLVGTPYLKGLGAKDTLPKLKGSPPFLVRD